MKILIFGALFAAKIIGNFKIMPKKGDKIGFFTVTLKRGLFERMVKEIQKGLRETKFKNFEKNCTTKICF